MCANRFLLPKRKNQAAEKKKPPGSLMDLRRVKGVWKTFPATRCFPGSISEISQDESVWWILGTLFISFFFFFAVVVAIGFSGFLIPVEIFPGPGRRAARFFIPKSPVSSIMRRLISAGAEGNLCVYFFSFPYSRFRAHFPTTGEIRPRTSIY